MPRILIVDDEEWNIKVLENQLRTQGYALSTARNADEALVKLNQQAFDLILLDVMMPGKDGFSVCRELKAQKQYQSVPILLVTALQETTDKVKGLEAGAADFLTKPVNKAELTARVRAHLRIKSLVDEVELWNRTLEHKVEERTRTIQEKNKQLDESYFMTLGALSAALDLREHETGKHSLRVAFYTAELARKAGISGAQLEEISMGGLLHDIGKIGTPDRVLLKPGKLTVDEWVVMRQHPGVGWTMIKDIEFIGKGRDLVLAHQEKFDGTGYPRKLKGEEIFIGARFFSIVDVFDALQSERPYKKAFSFEKSVAIIREGIGSHFDPRVVDLFLSVSERRWCEIREEAERSEFKDLIFQIRKETSEIRTK